MIKMKKIYLIFRTNMVDIYAFNQSSMNTIFECINSPSQEVLHWQQSASSRKQDKHFQTSKYDAANRISTILQEVSDVFKFIDIKPYDYAACKANSTQIFRDIKYLEESFGEGCLLESVLCSIFEVVEARGVFAYSAARMRHLLHIISQSLCQRLRYLVLAYPAFFHMDFNSFKTLVRRTKYLIQAYLAMISRLTTVDFAFRETDPFLGGPLTFDILAKFVSQIDTIYDVRMIHDEFVALWMISKNVDTATIPSFEKVFSSSTLLDVSHIGETIEFDKAVSLYTSNLSTLASELCVNIQSMITQHNFSSLMTMNTLKSFTCILNHLPNMKYEIERNVPEIECLLANIVESITSMIEKTLSGPDILTNMIIFRQLRTKIVKLMATVNRFTNSDKLHQNCHKLSEKCEYYIDKLSKTWIQDSYNFLESYQLLSVNNRKLLHLDDHGYLRIVINEKYTDLLEQERIFSTIGVNIPSDLKAKIKVLRAIIEYVYVLRNITVLYNKIRKSIPPELMSLLAHEVVVFNNILSDEQNWLHLASSLHIEYIHINSFHRFACNLKETGIELRNRVDYLSKMHDQHISIMSSLMTSTLHENKQGWLKAKTDLNTYLGTLESSYGGEILKSYLNYWDCQIYKALEGSFLNGLLNYPKYMGEIRCSLIVKNDMIEFQPSLGEVRINLYARLREYIQMPTELFSSQIGDNIFSNMIHSNLSMIYCAYYHIEEVIHSMEVIYEKYLRWLNINEFNCNLFMNIYKNSDSHSEIESNLQTIVCLKKAACQIPDVEVLYDNIEISLGTIPSYIKHSLEKVHTSFLQSLAEFVIHDCHLVADFLKKSTKSFRTSVDLMDPEELQSYESMITEIKDMKFQMVNLRNSCTRWIQIISDNTLDNHNMNEKILVCKNLIKVDESSYWDNLDQYLSSYFHTLEPCKVELRRQLIDERNIMNERIKKLKESWELKKSTVQNESDIYHFFQHQCKYFEDDLEKLVVDAQRHSEHCKIMSTLDFDFAILINMRKDLTSYTASWEVFCTYETEKNELISRKWIHTRYRLNIIDEFLNIWYSRLIECTKNLDRCFENVFLADLNEISRIMDILKTLVCKHFRDDHWNDLFYTILKFPKSICLDNVTIKDFVNAKEILQDDSTNQSLIELQKRAQEELALKETLQEVIIWSQKQIFNFSQQPIGNLSLPIIVNADDILVDISDHLSTLGSIRDSSFYGTVSVAATSYETKLSQLDECIRRLLTVQQKLLYLCPVVVNGVSFPDISKLRDISEQYQSIMLKIQQVPNCFTLLDHSFLPNFKNSLVSYTDVLDHCQRSLSTYLEEKRLIEPRLYFVGDEGLLEMLGNHNHDYVIRKHLKHLFQAIFNVGMKSSTIFSIMSEHGEEVDLKNFVNIGDKSPETWLDQLAREQRKTLYLQLLDIFESSIPVDVLMTTFPCQILCLMKNIKFTESVELYLDRNENLLNLHGDCIYLLEELIMSHAQSTSSLIKLKSESLILDIIRNRDIADYLCNCSCLDKRHWPWQSQLRYYHNESSKSCSIKMGLTCFKYGFEYQGNQLKLVYTPLTDRCFLTLTHAMYRGYGGYLYGPAGTGKTESVKALGSALGRQVLVFNCDDGLDVDDISRLFLGIVMSGSWGCFDEFNRLTEEQISAVADQIKLILTAVKNKCQSMTILNKEISVNSDAAIFITLNPVSKDYGGRSTLPANLKALFRSISMNYPDKQKIIEVSLVSYGFVHARRLSRQVTILFSSSSQVLSSQRHYDWGLRTLKSVLHTAGMIYKERFSGGAKKTNFEENVIVQSLRIHICSKLTREDSSLFVDLVSDVFHVDLRDLALDSGFNNTIDAIKLLFSKEGDGENVEKILQLTVALDERVGCILLGPIGSGKTFLWRSLEEVSKTRGEEVQIVTLNPKAVERENLIGNFDRNTREWQDGIVTKLIRGAVSSGTSRTWIVFDGDIDPEWIEAFNSVLDDNRLLTLPTGERLCLPNRFNFIFETRALTFASPATVSRNAIVSFDYHSYQHQKNFYFCFGFFDKAYQTYFQNAVSFIRNCGLEVEVHELMLARNVCSFLKDCNRIDDFKYAVMKGLGLLLPLRYVEHLGSSILNITVDDVFLLKDTISSDENIRREFTFLDNRFLLLKQWIDSSTHFIMVGPSGCGKYSFLRSICSHDDEVLLYKYHCNAQTKPNAIIDIIKQTCTLHSTVDGQEYRPKDYKSIVLLLKDLYTVSYDKYGTSSFIAFVQQLMEYKGFFDEKNDFFCVAGIVLVVSIDGRGYSTLNTKFCSTFRIAIVETPNTDSLISFSSSILLNAISSRPNTPAPIDIADGESRMEIAQGMVALYQNLQLISKSNNVSNTISLHILNKFASNIARYNLNDNSFLEVFIHEAKEIYQGFFLDNYDSETLNTHIREILLQPMKKHSDDLKSERFFQSVLRISTPDSKRNTKKSSSNGIELCPCTELRHKIVKWLPLYYDNHPSSRIFLLDEVVHSFNSIMHSTASAYHHVIFIGSDVVGKKTLTRLMCFITGIEYAVPCVTEEWSVDAFFQQLKKIAINAVINNVRVCYFIEEHHLYPIGALENVSKLISCGDDIINSLFTDEECDSFFSNSNEWILNLNTGVDPKILFLERVRANLHIFINFGRSRDLEQTFLQNPSLIKYTKIVCLESWSRQSLKKFIQSNDIGDTLQSLFSDVHSEKVMDEILDVVLDIHISSSMQSYHSLIDLLQNWNAILSKKNKNYSEEMTRLEIGLLKIQESKSTIAELKVTSKNTQVDLEYAQADTSDMMLKLENELSKLQYKKLEADSFQLNVTANSNDISIRRGKIENEISGITPLLMQAKEAVQGINRNTLNEIRSLKTPPEAISDVLNAVLMILGIEDLSWLSMRKFLGKREIKQDIMALDISMIDTAVIGKVEKFVEKKKSSFDPKVIERVSMAAAPLAAWVTANLIYAKVLKSINPLEDELRKKDEELQNCEKILAECKNDLKNINVKLCELQDSLANKEKQTELFKTKLKEVEMQVKSSSQLIEKLADERIRWEDRLANLKLKKEQLCADTLLCSAFNVYLSYLDESCRDEFINKWSNKLTSLVRLPSYSYVSSMVDITTQLTWKNWGLSHDRFCIENATIISSSNDKVPLIHDPDEISMRWMLSYTSNLSSGKVEIVKACDSNINRTIKLCLKLGKSLILSGDNVILPYLYPLMRRDFATADSGFTIKIGAKEVDCHESFRLFLISKSRELGNFHDYSSIIRVISFAVTRVSIENKLVSILLDHHHPELEKENLQNFMQEKQALEELKSLEDSLLDLLSNVDGDCLGNENLIQNLYLVKEKSLAASESLLAISKTSEMLESKRSMYNDIGSFGSEIFELLSIMHHVNHFYRYDLEYFVELFKRSIQTFKSLDANTDHIKCMKSQILATVISNVSASMRSSDLEAFYLHLVHGLNHAIWTKNSWEFLVGSLDQIEIEDASFPSWLSNESRNTFAGLCTYFPEIPNKIDFESYEWKRWGSSADTCLSIPISNDTTDLDRLLLTKALRPDQLQDTIKEFCCKYLDLKTLSPPSLDLYRLWQTELNHQARPILLVCDHDHDPENDIEFIVNSTCITSSLRSVAVGLGQETLVLEMIKEASMGGYWLCIKNLHLGLNWLSKLNTCIDNLDKTENNFQLWLTTELHSKFPVNLIEKSLKVMMHSPRGLREHLCQVELECNDKTSLSTQFNQMNIESKLHILLIFLHVILKERSIYGKQGWAQKYEFSSSDILFGKLFIKDLYQEKKYVELQNLLITILYGAKMDDERDICVLRTYVSQYFDIELLSRSDVSFGESIKSLLDVIQFNCRPSLLGLPSNIHGTISKKKGFSIINQTKMIKKSPFVNITNNNSDPHNLNTLWKKIIKDEGPMVSISFNIGNNSMLCVMQCVKRELELGKTLYNMIDTTLALIDYSSIRSVSKLDDKNREILDLLHQNISPPSWRLKWEGKENATDWVKGVVRRIKTLTSIPDKIMKYLPINIMTFFHPQKLLISLHQDAARAMGCHLDELNMICTFEKREMPSTTNAICLIIDNIFIQGATLNDNSDGTLSLQETSMESAEYSLAPLLKISFVHQNAISVAGSIVHDQHILNIPLYTNSAREINLFDIQVALRDEKERTKWILAGVACFTEVG